MKLSGNEQEKLIKAIVSAYPNKNDLEMMVRFQLEENLDAIAGGENVTDIVFNLLTRWAIPRGKLEKFIQACYHRNPNNPDLNEFYQKTDIYKYEKLIDILKLYLQQERNQIIIAYKASLPNRLIDKKMPENEKEIISGLLLPENKDVYSYVQKFVGYLLLNKQVSVPFKQDLQKWAKENIHDCTQLIAELTQEQKQREQQCNPCLMIAISQSGNDYAVEAWLIKNLVQYHRESFSDCEQLKIDNKSEIPTDQNFSNLPKIIIDLIQQSLIKSNKDIKQIHIFLPSELMNHDFDAWRTEECDEGEEDFVTGISEDYEVVIRCSDRLRGKSPPVFKWRHKGNTFKDKLEQYANSVFVLGSSDNQKTLFDQVKQEHVIAVKITSVFDKGDVLGKIIFKSALPLALWTRKQIPDIEEEFNLILKHENNDISLKELPSQFKRKKGEGKNNINHLCLLWDDPDLLPPEQLLTQEKL
jgi:vWA-MoxR associated protein C-terminal domain/vWA-MoxR associated protein middle region (VMAP-M) 1/Effector-associated domain 1